MDLFVSMLWMQEDSTVEILPQFTTERQTVLESSFHHGFETLLWYIFCWQMNVMNWIFPNTRRVLEYYAIPSLHSSTCYR